MVDAVKRTRVRGSPHALRREDRAITGGGGGIGTALVRRFAEEAAHVRCIDIDPERAGDAARAAGTAAEAVIADVTVAADVARALAGGVDVLVNNTLSAIGDNLVTIDEETWRRDMDGTLTSAYLCSRAVLPGMIERRGGAIVNVASVNALGYYGNEAYSAAESGLVSLTTSVAARYGRYGVRANAVAPGSIRTAGLGRAGGASSPTCSPASGAGSRSGGSAHPTRWPRACSSSHPTRRRS